MFGAIYVGLSGLNAYSRGLQEVSNNVTNLNSSGFKSSSVSFTSVSVFCDESRKVKCTFSARSWAAFSPRKCPASKRG